MVVLKNKTELERMRAACILSAQALALAGEMVRPGITTGQIDKAIRRFARLNGARPSFLGYNGFPGSACISVNEQVIHGIPGGRVIMDGDIVSIDVGMFKNGFHGDNAATFAAGDIPADVKMLLEATEESLYKGIEKAFVGGRVGDIGHAVETHVRGFGLGVVQDYIGHGVGKDLHESPEVPNFGKPGRGARLIPGMTLAIEPMVNLKGDGVKRLADGWTIVTESGSCSAHFEHTVAVTDNGPVILTRP
ncbi:MAG: type I methionyl aminopeptidase [Oscillospiraceae bacterium]|nr:type I methionyl aminopeptidase [Oscillospiraceae bacterium]